MAAIVGAAIIQPKTMYPFSAISSSQSKFRVAPLIAHTSALAGRHTHPSAPDIFATDRNLRRLDHHRVKLRAIVRRPHSEIPRAKNGIRQARARHCRRSRPRAFRPCGKGPGAAASCRLNKYPRKPDSSGAIITSMRAASRRDPRRRSYPAAKGDTAASRATLSLFERKYISAVRFIHRGWLAAPGPKPLVPVMPQSPLVN